MVRKFGISGFNYGDFWCPAVSFRKCTSTMILKKKPCRSWFSDFDLPSLQFLMNYILSNMLQPILFPVFLDQHFYYFFLCFSKNGREENNVKNIKVLPPCQQTQKKLQRVLLRFSMVFLVFQDFSGDTNSPQGLGDSGTGSRNCYEFCFFHEDLRVSTQRHSTPKRYCCQ